jgi:hypothetical protein
MERCSQATEISQEEVKKVNILTPPLLSVDNDPHQQNPTGSHGTRESICMYRQASYLEQGKA